MNTKGNAIGLAGLATTIILLVIAAFILVLGLQLNNGFLDATDNEAGSVSNEQGAINNTGYTLAQSTVPGYNSPTITSITNKTSGAVINSANWTLSGSTLTNATSIVWSAVNITYTYNYGGDAYKATNKTITGVGTFADFWSIIVLAIVISVVIGLILMVMGSRKVK